MSVCSGPRRIRRPQITTSVQPSYSGGWCGGARAHFRAHVLDIYTERLVSGGCDLLMLHRVSRWCVSTCFAAPCSEWLTCRETQIRSPPSPPAMQDIKTPHTARPRSWCRTGTTLLNKREKLVGKEQKSTASGTSCMNLKCGRKFAMVYLRLKG